MSVKSLAGDLTPPLELMKKAATQMHQYCHADDDGTECRVSSHHVFTWATVIDDCHMRLAKQEADMRAELQEAKQHIQHLLEGMVKWSADEDGVHEDAFDAFDDAMQYIKESRKAVG